jgi:hypothetical protein
MEILPFSDKNIMQENIPWMQAKNMSSKSGRSKYEELNELGNCLIS